MITFANYRLSTFRQARFRLTALYVLLSFFLLVVFSIGATNAEQRALIKIQQMTTVQNPRPFRTRILGERLQIFDRQFKERLMIYDGVLVLVAMVGSFWLSGVTLRPIREMIGQQEDFAAEASHELRTPLTTINMEIEAFRRTQKTSRPLGTMLTSLQEEVTRMKRIVDGLLILVRYDESPQKGAWKNLRLEEIVEEAGSQIKALAAEKKIKLAVVDLMAGVIQGDREQIKQVLLILLDNAVKYTPIGGQIELSMYRSKNRIGVLVQDTGMGIDKQDLPHIFRRFYRSSTAQKSHGTGLGLAIAQRLVTAHRGKIEVSSQIHKGTIVRVEWPEI